jgi:uncharacterized membrane protein
LSLATYLNLLQDLPVATAIREGDSAFPWLESIHVIAVATVFGTIAVLDLRLLGLPSYTSRISVALKDMLPYTWIAFATALVTGLLMFIANAPVYARNPYFQVKLAVILAAGLNMLVFHLLLQRDQASWDEARTPPARVRLAGGISLLLWSSVIVLGRWIGFTLN